MQSAPNNIKELRLFHAPSNIFRMFESNFARIAAPLTNNLPQCEPTHFMVFTDDESVTVTTLQEKPVSSPILLLPTNLENGRSIPTPVIRSSDVYHCISNSTTITSPFITVLKHWSLWNPPTMPHTCNLWQSYGPYYCYSSIGKRHESPSHWLQRAQVYPRPCWSTGTTHTMAPTTIWIQIICHSSPHS